MNDDPFDVPDASHGRGGREGDGSGSAGQRRWPWLVAGLVLGVAGALLVPRYVAPHLPGPFRAGEVRVEGPVLAEQQEEDRLLLTVETERGAMLATFRQQVSEIALLVEEGDHVALGVGEYRPFVEEPSLLGVWKGPVPAGPARTDTGAAGRLMPDSLAVPPPGGAGDTAVGGGADTAAPDGTPGS